LRPLGRRASSPVSAYFQVVKPTLQAGFDPHRLTWAQAGAQEALR
jgi:hypothetical protein